MKLQHYVLKSNQILAKRYLVLLDIICINLPAKKMLLKMSGLLSKLLASLMRINFPKRPSGAPLHTLSTLYDVPVGFCRPPSSLEAVYSFICGRRRVTVARYRIICQGHHREHDFCFLPRFTSVDWEGWSTSHFHLRQARWFQFPHHKLSVPE